MPDGRVAVVVDDEPQIRRAVANALRGIAERVVDAASASAALDVAAAERPDLVVLDLGLPDQDGLEVCRKLRNWATMPIVVLSARHSEAEKVKLFDAGADDYVTKPFNLEEFAARIRAHLRRARTSAGAADPVVQAGGLTIDLARRRVTRGNERIDLTPIEWEILAALAAHAGRTLTHRQIFDAVWRRSSGNAQQYLRVHITNLRRKIELEPAAPRVVVTEPGVGYRLETDS